MRIYMTVTFDGGRVEEITIGPRDQLAWEAAEPGRSIGAVVTNPDRIQDHYSLAFAAMRRQGLYSGSLKDLKDEADVEIGHADKPETQAFDDEDPTRKGPSTD